MSKQLSDGKNGPEIVPPEKRLATLSPTVRLYIRRAAITSLAGFLFWLLLWCLQSFLGVRGVVQMVASRILLFFMWLSGAGLIVLGALTLPRLQSRRLFMAVVNTVWIVGVVALDRWAPRPTPIPSLTATTTAAPVTTAASSPSPPSSHSVVPKQDEVTRRTALLEHLRQEYILSHDNISPALMAGTEQPPSEWINKRLNEMGEKWRVGEPHLRPASTPTPTPAAKVGIGIGVGDDKTVTARYFAVKQPWELQALVCPGMRCYLEGKISKPIDLNIGQKGWARVIYSVYNISDLLIPHPTVMISSSYDVNIAEANQQPDGHSVAFSRTTEDLVPYAKSSVGYSWAVDVMPDKETQVFAMTFSIFSANLTVHRMTTVFRVARPTQAGQ